MRTAGSGQLCREFEMQSHWSRRVELFWGCAWGRKGGEIMTIYEGILKKRLSDSLSKQLHELSWKNIITRPLQGLIWPIWSKPFCSWIALNTGDGCFITWYFSKYNQSYSWPISQLLHPLDQGALCRIHHCLRHEHFKKVQFAFTQRPNLHTYLHLELPCIYISIPLPCNWITLTSW